MRRRSRGAAPAAGSLCRFATRRAAVADRLQTLVHQRPEHGYDHRPKQQRGRHADRGHVRNLGRRAAVRERPGDEVMMGSCADSGMGRSATENSRARPKTPERDRKLRSATNRPVGAQDNRPRRKPWGTYGANAKPRRAGRKTPTRPRRVLSYAPTGLWCPTYTLYGYTLYAPTAHAVVFHLPPLRGLNRRPGDRG
jgi:hypothetical protein